MIDESNYAEAVGELRSSLARFRASGEYDQAQSDKVDVLAWFQPVFNPANLPRLTAAEFVNFLNYKNNKHWSGLSRLSGRLTSDIDALRAGLGILVDESRPIKERLDEAVSGVHGLGKGVATAILQVSYPGNYGVWNNTSEASMRALSLWPDFERGVSLGEKYVSINKLLLRLTADLDLDLWTLDSLWHELRIREEGEIIEDLVDDFSAALSVGEGARFGLERHLQDFLRDNWDETELGQEWLLYGEPGDDYPGYEYQTDVGRIDLLARHKQEARWLVVELKRGQTSDQTVGQVLRYMGWVNRHLADPGDSVEGLIVARSPDQSLLYALEMQPTVALNLYEVEFRLRPSSLDGAAN